MKRELAGRPLLGILGCLVVGLTASTYPLNLCLLILPLWLYQPIRVKGLCAVFFVVGVVMAPRPAVLVQHPTPFRGIATIVSPPKLYPDATNFRARANGMDFTVFVDGWADLAYGARVQLTGDLKPPAQGSEKVKAAQGISGNLNARTCQVVDPAPWIFQVSEHWRQNFVDFAYHSLPTKQAALLSALCFNTQDLVDDDTMDEMQRTGIVHLVSVSGAHVAILSICLLAVFTYLPISRPSQIGLLALVLAAYALATGFDPPIIRAIFMSLTGAVAYLFSRERDILSALAFAAIVYLLWHPISVYEIGFQLSFLTVGAFALLLHRRREHAESVAANLWAETREVLIASVVASLATAPIVAYYFGQISIISVISNVLTFAVMGPILILSIVSALIGWGWPVSTIVMGLLGWIQLTLDWLSPIQPVNIPEFSGYWLLPMYGLLLFTWRPIVRQP